jgi:phosphoglycolate phosphatase
VAKPEIRRFDAVIWDLDGTLVETRQDITTAVNLLLADRGLPRMSVGEVSAHVGHGAPSLISVCLRERGVTRMEQSDLEQAYESFRIHYRDHMLDESAPYPGVPELLERLHTAGVAMGVITNKPEELSRQLVEGLGLSRFFVGLLGGDSLSERKPSPVPLLHMQKKLGAGDHRCVMVGDMIIDVKAARAAGLPAAAVAWGFSPREKLLSAAPDLLAESPAILGEWILG